MKKKLSNIVIHYGSYLEYLDKYYDSSDLHKKHEEYIYQNDIEEFWNQNDIEDIVKLVLSDLVTEPKLFGYFDYTTEEILLIQKSNFDEFEPNQELVDSIVSKNFVHFADNFPLEGFKVGDYVCDGGGKCGWVTDIYGDDEIEIEVVYDWSDIEPMPLGVYDSSFWKVNDKFPNRYNNEL